ncbi:FecCD family ABC transporter permease [Enterococcus villorum]|uniref:ABC transporter permease n=2 Tax=Enterococcus villorum TaxID=112904 RepID=A0A511J037_9ENTE|nr:iron ABC transporter permease [Enterococcus villorum]EOH87582.1 ferrichrome transport system permease FhuG [Enterococcus villorum ATCC 700913]EOW77699.1 ferrichrome transport system permease FhuG [Enterococcus villorum ATCC 700913]GEL91396.1 ABC transporter permease [Enterococcus villorum]
MKKIKSIIFLLFLLLVIISIISLMVGTPFIFFDQLFDIFTGKGLAVHQLIVYQFRAPRLLISLLAGFCLGVSGFLLQGVTRNKLADSSILGMNAGAGFFVMVYLGFYANHASPFLLLFVAFLGGLLAAFLVYLFSYTRNGFLGMNRLLLAGIAVNAGLSALMILCTIKLSKENYAFVNSWLAGSIWAASWPYVFSLLPWAVVLIPVAMFYSQRIGLLSFGQERAQSLGLNVRRSQTILLLLAVALACGSVAVAGSLSFVGLLAPHVAKFIVHRENQWSFLLSGLIGAFFVNMADILARVILPSGEVPTGILIAIMGAPYFLYLLFSKRTIA